MKKNFLASLFMTFLVTLGWSQNTNLNYQTGLKLYNTILFEGQSKSIQLSDTSSFRYQYTNRNVQILNPSFAFQWKSKRNNFHEIELTNLLLNKVEARTEILSDTTSSQLISGDEITSTSLSVRYEFSIVLNKSKNKKVCSSIGFGMNPYFRKNKYSPLVSSLFPTTEKSFGLKAFLTPRITYFVTSKLFVDVNIPICLFDNFILTETRDNASLPVEQRTVSTFNFNQFPNFFSGRIGIGLKL
jgi:hypothetical protein